MSLLRDLLNRARWKDAGLHELEVHVLHRGAPGDRRIISGDKITAVLPAGIELAPEIEDGDPVFVPYHRFLEVLGAEGEPLWSKGRAPRAAASEVGAAVRPGSGPEPQASEVAPSMVVVLHEATPRSPLVLDGSAGEGGGQILRSSLALSMATGTPFVLEKVRAGRNKPGLMRQHLTAVKAAAIVCGAEVEGAEFGSSRVAFRPGPVVPGDRTLDIGTAGSAPLVAQTLALPLALAAGASRISVRGGTHVPWSPPYPFLAEAWLPLARRAGARLGLELLASGFYPAGGGEVVLTATPSGALVPLHLGDASGALAPLELHAIVAGLSEEIARRELAAATELLEGEPLSPTREIVRSPGPGNAMWLVARDEGTGVCNVFSRVGERGVPAEDIGRAVARDFLAWRASGTSVEPHLADQLILPIAIGGGGSFTTNELTLHALTNIEVIRAFTGRRLHAWELGESWFRVALRAADRGVSPPPSGVG
jgi:RNA 3'-terminal phosphate cyclase (ATP)